MIDKILSHFDSYRTNRHLAELLANTGLKEEFLGVSNTKMPEPDQIIADANALVGFATSQEYKVFAREVWARSLNHLDKILDAGTTGERLQYHRGALSASLDLLRLSYQARATREQMERDRSTAVNQ